MSDNGLLKELIDFYTGKKVIVTGNTGFKGTWLGACLKILGAEVYGYSLAAPTMPSMYGIICKENRYNDHEGDVRNFSDLSEFFQYVQPDCVFHLAAQPIVRTSYELPRYTYETNVMGTVNVLEASRFCDNIKGILNVTTDKVYENPEIEGYRFKEGDKLDGYDPYSNSKSCSELVTHSYVKSFFNDKKIAVSTARAGNVIGGGDFARDRLIPDCFRAKADRAPITVRNPNSVRPFQHVLDPIFAYLIIMAEQVKNPEKAGSYNVGPDEESCVNAGKMAFLFNKYWGGGIVVSPEQEENAPHEAGFLALDCTLLKNTFNWKPVWDIEESVKKTVEWYKAYIERENMRTFTIRQIREFIEEMEGKYA